MRRAAALLTVLLAACGGGDGVPTSAPVPPVTRPGTVTVAATGLPEGAAADLLVTGPLPGNAISRIATAGSSWADIPPGLYTVAVRPVRTSLGTWVGAPASFELTVAAAATVPLSAAYRPAPSAMRVTVTGLPASASASSAATTAVVVTPPGGSATPVPPSGAAVTLSAAQRADLPTQRERWTLTATSVTEAGARFVPSRTSLDTTVSFGDTARVEWRYTVATGGLAVAVTGLPAGLAANVRVLPAGTDTVLRALTGTATITGLEPGRYRVVSATVTQLGIAYRPATDTLTVDVAASLTATPAPVTYAAQVGRLALTVNGLPTGTTAPLRLTGPGIDRVVTGVAVVDSLPIGPYTITASAVRTTTDRYAPAVAARALTIATGATVAAEFTYGVVPTVVDVPVTGLPAGTNAAIQLTDPSGATYNLTGAFRVLPALAGRWRQTASPVNTGAAIYAPTPTSRDTTVLPGDTLPFGIRYTLATGSLAVVVSGLPNGTNGNVTVTGPGGYTRTLTATTTLVLLTPGSYTVSAAPVTGAAGTYLPALTSQSVTVSASPVAAGATVLYTLPGGSLTISATGLPAGLTPVFTLSGPTGTRTQTGTGTVSGLAPGTWTVSAPSVSSGPTVYSPTPASVTTTVVSNVVGSVTFAYAAPAPTGSLTITASGLPSGAVPVFTLNGPGGTRTQPGPGTVTGLGTGSWTVSASTVSASGITYSPTPGSTGATISANATSTVSFAYAAPVTGPNFTISHVYLTQAIQQLDNSVALVAGREALLRVFVTANGANSARPDVRVRIYDGSTLLSTTTITAPEPSVRTSLAEGVLGSTWNVVVPAANVRLSMRVLVDLDPGQTLTEATRTDNVWPASGSPQPITVRAVPLLSVRFVPVVTGTDTGRVTMANRESFLVTTRRLFPLQTVVSDVRLPFTATATALRSDDSDGKWLTVLSELEALRASDGAPGTTHYFGIVRARYTSGVAGYAFLPGRAAVGWDYLPSGDNVAAHELGHNFGRAHTPCDVTGDPNYPYPGGVIGGFGWNSGTNSIVANSATDIMGYCDNNWVSDYTWTGVLNHRATAGFMAPALGAVRGEGLLVWGRVVDGRIELEPAFRVHAPATPSPRAATHRVELFDETGQTLSTLPIVAQPVDHVPAGREHRAFAVVVPWSATLEQQLVGVRVRDVRVPTRAAEQRAAVPRTSTAAPGRTRALADSLADAPAEQLERAGRQVRVRWDNPAYRMAMVRDASTGQIMGFVRSQGADVATGGRPVEVVFSDGVRSVVRR